MTGAKSKVSFLPMSIDRINPTVFDELDQATRAVAHCYCALHPIPLPRSTIVKICGEVNLRIGKRRLTQVECKHAIRQLIDSGLAYRLSDNTNLLLHDDCAMALMRHGDPDLLNEFWRGYNPGRFGYGYGLSNPDVDMAMARQAILTNDFSQLQALYRVPADVWRFLVYDHVGDFFARVPDEYRSMALTVIVHEMVDELYINEFIIDICMQSDDAALFAGDVAFLRAMQGRFAEALGTFEQLPETSRKLKAAVVAECATDALMGALQYDDTRLQRGIDAACAAQLAGTRKKQTWIDSPAFAIASAALIRIESPRTRELLDRLLKAAGRDRNSYYDSFPRAARAILNSDYLSNRAARSTLDLVLKAFVATWMEGPDNYAWQDFREFLAITFKRSEHHKMSWLAAECAAALRCMNEQVAEQKSMPWNTRQTEFDADGLVSFSEITDRADELHEQLGTTTLTALLRPRAEWESALQDLELLAYEKSKQVDTPKSASTAAKVERLAWIVASQWGEASVKPMLQRQKKNGSWTRGQPVSGNRLVNDSITISCLTEPDQAVIAAARREPYRDNAYYFDGAAVYALAGHPHVLDASGKPLDVARTEPELRLDEDELGQVTVQISPYADGDMPYVVTLMPARCEVTRLSPSHRRLCDIIPDDGLALPREAQGRLIEAVMALAGEVRIQSNIGGAAAGSVSGDPRPWVQLVPAGAGLTATIIVEPVADSGQFFSPGVGGAQVYATSAEGGVMSVVRDLQAERAELITLLDACPAIPANHSPADPLTLPHPALCVELLEQLQQANARCAWPNGETFRIVANATSQSLRVDIKSKTDWFAASATLAVDKDRALDLKQLFELLDAQSGSRFLEIEAGEFLILTESFRRELEELKALTAPGKGGTLRVHPMAAGLMQELLAESEVSADRAWDAQCKRFAEAQNIEVTIPGTLQADLRPYQVQGVEWLIRLGHMGAGACLADDMGLGKTVQALALLLHRAPNGASLVVAPTSVVGNWLKEATRFAPTLNVINYGGDKMTRAALLESLSPYDVVMTTYGLLQNDIDAMAKYSWATVVLDEAQAIKNMATKRARAVQQLDAGFRLATTGTPIQNNLMDLFSLFRFLNPGMLGSAAEFQRRFAGPIERDSDVEVRSRLTRLIAPFLLRRTKTEVLPELPPRTEITLEVELSAEEATLYEALRQRAVEDLEQGEQDVSERRLEVFAHLTRLRLACCNPALVKSANVIPSSKLAMFAETLDEILKNRHKVLVFSQFVKHLKLVAEHLDHASIDYHYLDGSTSAAQRQKRIDAFQAGERDVFLISLKAGGTGLNLTAADYVIHLDPWWNPAAEDQASDRAHRIGQSRPVTIYRLVAKGTIEEQIVELHRHKRNLAEQLLEGTDAPAALDAAELLALLRD